jgi:hypothetical protein
MPVLSVFELRTSNFELRAEIATGVPCNTTVLQLDSLDKTDHHVIRKKGGARVRLTAAHILTPSAGSERRRRQRRSRFQAPA